MQLLKQLGDFGGACLFEVIDGDGIGVLGIVNAIAKLPSHLDLVVDGLDDYRVGADIGQGDKAFAEIRALGAPDLWEEFL